MAQCEGHFILIDFNSKIFVIARYVKNAFGKIHLKLLHFCGNEVRYTVFALSLILMFLTPLAEVTP